MNGNRVPCEKTPETPEWGGKEGGPSPAEKVRLVERGLRKRGKNGTRPEGWRKRENDSGNRPY